MNLCSNDESLLILLYNADLWGPLRLSVMTGDKWTHLSLSLVWQQALFNMKRYCLQLILYLSCSTVGFWYHEFVLFLETYIYFLVHCRYCCYSLPYRHTLFCNTLQYVIYWCVICCQLDYFDVASLIWFTLFFIFILSWLLLPQRATNVSEPPFKPAGGQYSVLKR